MNILIFQTTDSRAKGGFFLLWGYVKVQMYLLLQYLQFIGHIYRDLDLNPDKMPI